MIKSSYGSRLHNGNYCGKWACTRVKVKSVTYRIVSPTVTQLSLAYLFHPVVPNVKFCSFPVSVLVKDSVIFNCQLRNVTHTSACNCFGTSLCYKLENSLRETSYWLNGVDSIEQIWFGGQRALVLVWPREWNEQLLKDSLPSAEIWNYARRDAREVSSYVEIDVW